MNAFAKKYLALFERADTTEEDVCRTFADECFALGIDMDLGRSLVESYGKEPWLDAGALKKIADEISDADVLASAIFSKWRYITHWSFSDSCMSSDNREWFVTAFRRLVEITE
ncbi:MAG: hypothetical protein IK020_00095 [Clostridiales bacterium]|nr:hypothetical protein [Clostridiales bacterium]